MRAIKLILAAPFMVAGFMLFMVGTAFQMAGGATGSVARWIVE